MFEPKAEAPSMSWLIGEWSPAYLIYHYQKPWFEHCEQRSGVYRLLVLEWPYSTPIAIDRVCGRDETGTLYIGGSTRLPSRIGHLVMQHRSDYKTKNHKEMPGAMKEKFGNYCLAVSWSYVDVDPFDREWELLRGYRKQFGEFPPLDG